MGAAWLIQISGFTCGAFLICVDATLLQSVVETIAHIVYLGLSLVCGAVPLRPRPQDVAQSVERISVAACRPASVNANAGSSRGFFVWNEFFFNDTESTEK